MRSSDRDKALFEIILEHCQRIEEACKRFGDNFEAFDKDADYQDVINMNIFQKKQRQNTLTFRGIRFTGFEIY